MDKGHDAGTNLCIVVGRVNARPRLVPVIRETEVSLTRPAVAAASTEADSRPPGISPVDGQAFSPKQLWPCPSVPLSVNPTFF